MVMMSSPSAQIAFAKCVARKERKHCKGFSQTDLLYPRLHGVLCQMFKCVDCCFACGKKKSLNI